MASDRSPDERSDIREQRRGHVPHVAPLMRATRYTLTRGRNRDGH